MAIEFRCSQCGRLLRTGDDTAGRMAQCPEGGSQTPVPFPTEETPVTPIDVEPIESDVPGSPISGPAGSTPFESSPLDSQAGGNPYASPYQNGPLPPHQDPYRNQATIALVLGILGLSLSIVCCICAPIGFVVSLSGLVFGISGRRSTSNRHLAEIGLVLSGVGLAISVITGGFFIISSLMQNH